MIKTLNQLKQELQIFADAHLQINEFYFGNFNQIYNEKIIRHTFLIADTQNIAPKRVRGGGSYTDITFIISACDQVFPDQSNWMDVKSDTFQIIMDCRNIFESPRWKAFSSVQGSPTVTYFEQKGSDRVNGWVMNVTLRIPDLRDLCAIPLVDYNLDSQLESLCAGVTIIEDGVYTQTIPSGGTFEYSTGGGGSVTIQVNGVEYVVELAPSTIDIPVINSDANAVGTVDPGVNVIIADSSIDINGTNYIRLPAEVNLDIPVINSNGDPIGSVDSGIGLNIEDSIVENSNASYTNQFPSGTTFVLPNINLTQPNGDIQSNVSAIDLSCTLISALATQDLNDDLTPTQINQIQRQQPTRTGQVVSFRTGDDGNLQMGIGASFATLSDNNIFGDTKRFTDELGGQTYTNKFVLDHLTGLMWYVNVTISVNWNTAIDGAEASTQGGFSDWFLPNINQFSTILNFANSVGSLINYSPFNLTQTSTATRIWLSTTNAGSTTAAWTISDLQVFSSTTKTTSCSYIICRKWIPSDFGL